MCDQLNQVLHRAVPQSKATMSALPGSDLTSEEEGITFNAEREPKKLTKDQI